MIMTPARTTEANRQNLLSSPLSPARNSVRRVFPSYFAAGTQIFPESTLPNALGPKAARFHFSSQLLPSPLARRVA
jgi:hypothetical protein